MKILVHHYIFQKDPLTKEKLFLDPKKRLHSFLFISTWPIKHMKAFFRKNKHMAHEAFDEKNKHIKGFDCRM